MEGYLLKEGAGVVKSYKKRYFTLKGNALTYYRSKEDMAESLGVVEMCGAEIKETQDHEFGFSIKGPNFQRSYNLAAESKESMEAWFAKLREAANLKPSAKADEETTLFSKSSAEGQKVGIKDFEMVKVIGRGSFGKVMKVRRKGTDEIYAMKALRKDVIVREKMETHTKAEKTILQSVDHPFICKLHYAFQTKERLYLVLDLLPGGELFFHLQSDGAFTIPRARYYAACICSALDHLHQQNIAYRDLKPENIVLDKDGNACLTDFGLAKTALNANQQTHTFCGTPEYIAPEILKGTGHGKAVDWWAIGVLLYEMIVGIPPFYSENVDEMYQLILSKPLEFPEDPEVPKDAQDLLTKLLQRDPAQRLTDGAEIMKHPFFTPIDFAKLLKRELKAPFLPDLSLDYIDSQMSAESIRPSVCQAANSSNPASFQGFTFQR
eukprot:NODE_1847_length_1382_cov_6.795199_g1671_i0.p1 GENE.NODE_1847_length_1382_cov_6.795199_g1671_i0~~NODE_1847_length_1382_cov_6.795199_g1671_i0.p1  ORF type:complete len:437 (+),score=107.27 NODE_1847_length_1382_cov_6.795199_g1671_i0:41-1351(+)